MLTTITKRPAKGRCSLAVRRAFAAADLLELRAKRTTQRRAAAFLGVSIPYLIAAAKVSKDPVLKAQVLSGQLGLLAAAKQTTKPMATDLFESADLFDQDMRRELRMPAGKVPGNGKDHVRIYNLAR